MNYNKFCPECQILLLSGSECFDIFMGGIAKAILQRIAIGIIIESQTKSSYPLHWFLLRQFSA
jgi:hypothetical protein